MRYKKNNTHEVLLIGLQKAIIDENLITKKKGIYSICVLKIL